MTLLTPDSYQNDWYGWVTNQSGHFVLGIIISAITKRLWPILVIAISAEVIQKSPDIVDSITDVAFTLAGGVFYQYASNVLLWSVIVAFITGMFQRRK